MTPAQQAQPAPYGGDFRRKKKRSAPNAKRNTSNVGLRDAGEGVIDRRTLNILASATANLTPATWAAMANFYDSMCCRPSAAWMR